MTKRTRTPEGCIDHTAAQDAQAAAWAPKTYPVTHRGRKTRVTVPASIDEADLLAALKDNLSPQAIATIVVYLQPAKTNNRQVDGQVAWFAERLVELVGGVEQQNRLADELGL